MSNQEAIALLRNLEDALDSYCELNEEGKTAFRMAIEALSCSEIPNGSDTISRREAIAALDKRFDSIPMEQTTEILQLRKDLRELPPAQPERKRGRWIYNSPVTMKCDQCGLVIKDWDWHRFKFCPNCDCDMRGEENG
jgi:hypothetical protein